MNIFAKPFKDLGVIEKEKEKGKEKITYIIKINNYRNYKNSKQKHFGEGEKIIVWIRLTLIYRKDNNPKEHSLDGNVEAIEYLFKRRKVSLTSKLFIIFKNLY